MLLPQAGAFQALTERMHLVQSSLLLEVRHDESTQAPSRNRGDWWSGTSQDKRTSELAGLLQTFDKISQI